ncbi:MAG: AbrB/MazE/SpoVT family DNA-binding domain-containing protein [Polyangiales bacterium]
MDATSQALEERIKIAEGGRLVIPAKFRKSLQLQPGSEVLLRLHDDHVELITPACALKRAQSLVQAYIPKDTTLVDALLEERHKEQAEEDAAT